MCMCINVQSHGGGGVGFQTCIHLGTQNEVLSPMNMFVVGKIQL